MMLVEGMAAAVVDFHHQGVIVGLLKVRMGYSTHSLFVVGIEIAAVVAASFVVDASMLPVDVVVPVASSAGACILLAAAVASSERGMAIYMSA